VRLLFDQNLSRKIVQEISDEFPECQHIVFEGLDEASDEAIWKLAADKGFMIVSKDRDFASRSIVRGSPPKVLWLRVGNCTTHSVVALLKRHADLIKSFEEQDAGLLVLPPGVVLLDPTG
jgi:predicted nuclease of predicted toxin-antitoxin system